MACASLDALVDTLFSPASKTDMQRDEVVEVERIKITKGPRKDREGWIYSDYLQRLLTITSL